MTASAVYRVTSPNPQLELSLMAPEPLAIEALAHGGSDAAGWQLGFDHAKHGLPLPAAHLHQGSPLFAGWQAALAKAPNTRHRDPAPGSRHWFALRLQAWQEGIAFEDHLLTPHYLTQLQVQHCPVSRLSLHDEAGHPQARRWARLRQDQGYSAGHLVCLGATAAKALEGRNAADLRAMAQHAAATACTLEGLDASAWARLAGLVALVTPDTDAVQALPVQAPNRLVIVNPLQALQAWVARQLGAAGWAQRLQALHDALPTVAARQAASALAAALAPHALTVPLNGPQRLHALEDLWLDARVQRRWHALAQTVSPLTAERLLTLLPSPQGVHMALHARVEALAA